MGGGGNSPKLFSILKPNRNAWGIQQNPFGKHKFCQRSTTGKFTLLIVKELKKNQEVLKYSLNATISCIIKMYDVRNKRSNTISNLTFLKRTMFFAKIDRILANALNLDLSPLELFSNLSNCLGILQSDVNLIIPLFLVIKTF